MDGLVRPTLSWRPLAAACAALAAAALLSPFGAAVAAAEVQTEDLTLKTGDTPKLRLEQTNSGGFTPQIWDVGGNEAGFFVRDSTHSSLIPFRIRPSAPHSSFYMDEEGQIGLGAGHPEAALDIRRDGAVSIRYTDRTPAATGSWLTGIPAGGGSFAIGLEGSPAALTLAPTGDLALLGSLGEAATQGGVADVQPVDPGSILDKLGALPIRSWAFAGSPDRRHLGPLAGDFSASFGLGSAASVAPADVAGVALVAVQGLIAQNRSLAARLDRAEATAAEAKAAAAKATAATVTAAPAAGDKGTAAATVDRRARATNAKLARKLRKLGKQMRKLRRAISRSG